MRKEARWAGGRWQALLLWLWLGVSCGFCPAAQAQSVSKEYQLKAAFLYNFTKFADWPATRFATSNAPIVIGVLGNNPFNGELAKAVQDRVQNGRSFLVTNLTSTAEAPTVHLLFVPQGQEPQFIQQLATLNGTGVLSVGESESFAAAPGIITFTTESSKIRLEINLDAADAAGVKISSRLLQLAKVVRRNPAGGPAP